MQKEKYTKNSLNYTKKLKIINNFSKVEGYKISSQNWVSFLYSNHTPKGDCGNAPFTGAAKKTEVPRDKPSKYMRDLYYGNIKSLKKETEKDTRKWEDSSGSWPGRINIMKMVILLHAIYRLNEIPQYSSQGKTRSYPVEPQEIPNRQSNPEQRTDDGEVTTPDFTIYCRNKVMELVCY